MSDLEHYRSFSYFVRSDRIEERLMRRFLPRFEELLDPPCVLADQRDVTGKWLRYLDSTVRAHSWSVVDGVTMVLVLLDDEDFGREIKWFFKCRIPVDYKHLVMAAEGGTELLLAGASSTTLSVKVDDLGDRMVRSSMFCFSFPASQLDAGRIQPGTTWRVSHGLDASVSRSGEDRGLLLQGTGRIDEHLLLLLRAQMEILSD